MNEPKVEVSAGFPWGKVALFSVAAYVLWVNRFKVQEILESNGIATPWLNNTLGDAIQSGAAKASGIVKNEINHPTTIM